MILARRLPSGAAFAGLAVVFAAFFLAAGAPTPLLALRQAQWGFSAGMLTLAFAVYALGLVGAVLTAGSLSDHLGRRPVLLGAVAGELVAMVAFLLAPTIGWIVVARIVQGVATGFGTSAFTAAILEHAPERYQRLGTIIASTAAAGGLGLGALLTGAAVQFTSGPNTLVFGTLTVTMAVGFLVVALTRETREPRPGAIRSLNPRLRLPAHIRGEFLGGVPVHVGAWMFGGLLIGLSPAILRIVFGVQGGLEIGVTAFLAPATAAVMSLVLGSVAARLMTGWGSVLVALGTVLIAAAVIAEVLPLLWVGAVVGGAGFGATFAGGLRQLGPMVAAHERAGVFAGVYATAYLAFGIPAIIAGQLTVHVGVRDTVEAYAAAVLVMAALGVTAQVLLHVADRRRSAADDAAALAEISQLPPMAEVTTSA